MRYYPPSAFSLSGPSQTRRRHTRLIDEYGTKLGFPIFTLLEAKRLFHEYHLSSTPNLGNHNSTTSTTTSTSTNSASFEVIIACLLLASKLDDTLKKAKDVSSDIYGLSHRNLSTKAVDDVRKKVVNLEVAILEKIAYDFMTCPVLDYTVKFIKTLGGVKEHAIMALRFSFHFYDHAVCARYPPSLVAAGAVYLTFHLYGHEKHFKLEHLGIPETEMEIVHEIALKILEQKLAESSSSSLSSSSSSRESTVEREMYQKVDEKLRLWGGQHADTALVGAAGLVAGSEISTDEKRSSVTNS